MNHRLRNRILLVGSFLIAITLVVSTQQSFHFLPAKFLNKNHKLKKLEKIESLNTTIPDYEKIFPTSPNAASLGKYGDIPVSHHTGVPNISIPIHTLTEGELSVPISLSYHSSGIKVDELASWVGLGWSLNAGGAITRTIVGAHDEGAANTSLAISNKSGSGWYKDNGLIPELLSTSCLTNPNTPIANCRDYYMDAAHAAIDTEPDMYNFNVGGYAGKFFFDEFGRVQIHPKQDIKIDVNFSNNTFNSWTLTTPEGTIYTFGGTNAVEHTYHDGNGIGANSLSKETSTTWYLTKIEAMNGDDYIDFHYIPEKYSYANRGGHSVTFGGPGASSCLSGSPDIAPQNAGITTVEGVRLHQITTKSDRTKIEFKANYFRTDLSRYNLLNQTNNEAKRLDKIKIKRGTWEKSVDLSYNYFTSSSSSSYPVYSNTYGGGDRDRYRLKLTAVQEKVGSVVKKPHYFYYNEGSQYPMARRLSLARDHWGYYNGADNNQGLLPPFTPSIPSCSNQTYGSANRTPDGKKMKSWILREIKYPTGGNTKFEYEAHRENSVANIVGGLRVKKISSDDKVSGKPMIQNFEYGTGILYAGNPDYVQDINQLANPLIATIGNLFASIVSSTPKAPMHQTQGYHIGYTDVFINYGNNGKSRFSYYNTGYASPVMKYPAPPTRSNLGMGDLMKEYHYDKDGDVVKGSEFYYTQDFERDVVTKKIVSANSTVPCDPQSTISFCGEYALVTDYNLPVGRRLLSRKVEIQDGVQTSTHYEYSPNHNQPIKETVINSDESEHVVEYDYSFDEIDIACTVSNSCYSTYSSQYQVIASILRNSLETCEEAAAIHCSNPLNYALEDCAFGPNPLPWSGCENNCVLRETRDCSTPHWDQFYVSLKIIQDNYRTCKSGIINAYNQCVQNQLNSAIMEDRVVAEMYIKNINAPLETRTYVDNVQTGGTRTKYEINTHNDLVPFESFAYFPTSGNNGTWEKRVNIEFDANNNLSQYNKEHDIPKSIIWAHDNMYPVGKVINASANEVAYTSFEQYDALLPSQNGNIRILKGTSSYPFLPNGGKTGKNCFRLNDGSDYAKVQFLPQVTGDYIVSFWYKTGTVKVLSGVSSILATTPSAGSTWEYFEKEVNLNQSIALTLEKGSSFATIDELRIYPKDAMMTTYAYDDNDGQLLTITDENNISANFEYDEFKRLKLVKDNDGNIVQTQEYNYQTGNAINNVKSNTVLISGQTTLSQVNGLSGSDIKRTVQYLDGLGRPIQSVAVQQSPTSKDIVEYIEYDELGRNPKSYLPFASSTNNGAYRYSAKQNQAGFFTNYGGGSISNTTAISESVFDNSPLNRVIEQGAPGTDWQIGNNHTIKSNFRGNETTDGVRDFNNNSFYSSSLLLVNEITDENGNTSLTFIDKLGRTILSRQVLDNNNFADTYSIYDNLGRVIKVVSPEATERLKSNGWNFSSAAIDNLIYKYEYDGKSRIIRKKIPGKGWEYLVYDKLDRVVLTQDGNLRAANDWLFTKYDVLSRSALTGKYTNPTNYSESFIRNAHSNATTYNVIHDGSGTYKYSNTAAPTIGTEVYSVTYYDSYDIDKDGINDYSLYPMLGYQTNGQFNRVRGKITSSKTLVHDGSNLLLGSAIMYDDRGRIIQTLGNNHLNGSELTTSKYDFAGKLKEQQVDHTVSITQQYIRTNYDYVYDHAGRLLETKHKITRLSPSGQVIGSSQQVTLSKNTYDERDQLKKKELYAVNNSPFLQKVDYNYNIRGWMTSINDVNKISDDVFAMLLSYNAGNNNMNSSSLYNGNISSLTWRVKGRDKVAYGFQYDKLSRLTNAKYVEYGKNGLKNVDRYNIEDIGYDKNGNMNNIKRRGLISSPEEPEFGYIDDMTYSYNEDNPNQLTRVDDEVEIEKGFLDGESEEGFEYFFDANGNMVEDGNKGIGVMYNYMNLPTKVSYASNKYIEWTYDAAGIKLSKTVVNGGSTNIKHYAGGIEYNVVNGNYELEAVYNEEGRVIETSLGSGDFKYEFSLKDHLGNSRVTFSDLNGDGVITASNEIIQENHFYPFGMNMEGDGSWYNQTGPTNHYQYNGKELNDDFGLNWLDYGARWYDPSIARWSAVDPLAEEFSSWSPYNYVFSNPVFFVDPDGMAPNPSTSDGDGDGDGDKTKPEELKPVPGAGIIPASRINTDPLEKTLGEYQELTSGELIEAVSELKEKISNGAFENSNSISTTVDGDDFGLIESFDVNVTLMSGNEEIIQTVGGSFDNEKKKGKKNGLKVEHAPITLTEEDTNNTTNKTSVQKVQTDIVKSEPHFKVEVTYNNNLAGVINRFSGNSTVNSPRKLNTKYSEKAGTIYFLQVSEKK